MRPSQYVLYLFMPRRDKETYRALELGVRYDYNNVIESNGKHEITIKRNPCRGENNKFESFHF